VGEKLWLMDGLQLTKTHKQGPPHPSAAVLSPLVTDDGTFADPELISRSLLRPA
jgi:hypothetical protein